MKSNIRVFEYLITQSPAQYSLNSVESRPKTPFTHSIIDHTDVPQGLSAASSNAQCTRKCIKDSCMHCWQSAEVAGITHILHRQLLQYAAPGDSVDQINWIYSYAIDCNLVYISNGYSGMLCGGYFSRITITLHFQDNIQYMTTPGNLFHQDVVYKIRHSRPMHRHLWAYAHALQ